MCGRLESKEKTGRGRTKKEANGKKGRARRVDRVNVCMRAYMSPRDTRRIESLWFGMRRGATNTRHPYRDRKRSCKFRDPETGESPDRKRHLGNRRAK